MKLLTRLPAGWVEIGTTGLERFEDEYAAEIAKGHPLYGVSVRAIARWNDGDEVLFRVLRHLLEYAVVRLTWSGREESHDEPRFAIFTDENDPISELRKREIGNQ